MQPEATVNTDNSADVRNEQIARTIREQIGAGAFLMMGTKPNEIMREGADLSFRIRGSKQAKHVKVHLNGHDLYDLTFFRQRKAPSFEVITKVVGDIYVEDLNRVIEMETGLALQVPRIQFHRSDLKHNNPQS